MTILSFIIPFILSICITPLHAQCDQPKGPPIIHGIRIETEMDESQFDDDGIPDIIYLKEYQLRLFGTRLTPNMVITLTAENRSAGEFCEFPINKAFPVIQDTVVNAETCLIKIMIPNLEEPADELYICVKENEDNGYFIHQGFDAYIQLYVHEMGIPLWAEIIIAILCLSCSCLLSGLNIGLLSMDKTELRVICNAGNQREKEHAATILPIRLLGNYLLCSILIGNTLVNAVFTVILDKLTSGVTAVIASTIALTIIGEIIPQALCNKYGLIIGAKTIYITKFIMLITYPVSYPVAKILDYILGEEIRVFDRERLKQLITLASDTFHQKEVNIMSGALELNRKTVAEIMTKIDDVFMLEYDSTILDFETVSQIIKSGYSRIPVYESNRKNIIAVLLMKDLVLIDPDDRIPLKTICQFYQNPCIFVFEDVTLDVMFRNFKEGIRGHMAFVHKLNTSDQDEPFYECVGLVTLEDVLEELIQEEIMDESDVITDNVTKRRRSSQSRQDFYYFTMTKHAENDDAESSKNYSPQLTLTAYQFLSTSLEEFHQSVISQKILTRLLKRDIFYHVSSNDSKNLIYEAGVNADYFVLILEGKVEVIIGAENLIFEAGIFTYFGIQALSTVLGASKSSLGSTEMQRSSLDAVERVFEPDYTVRAATDDVVYLKITGRLYLAAVKATMIENKSSDDHDDEPEEDDDGQNKDYRRVTFDLAKK